MRQELKRSLSTSPHAPHEQSKRSKRDVPIPVTKRSPSLDSSPSLSNSFHPHGSSHIPLQGNGQEGLEELVRAEIRRLARERKRVVGNILRFTDGIAIDWIVDNSVNEDEILDSNNASSCNRTHHTVPSSTLPYSKPPGFPPDLEDSNCQPSFVAGVDLPQREDAKPPGATGGKTLDLKGTGRHSMDPIVIIDSEDEDMEPASIRSSEHPSQGSRPIPLLPDTSVSTAMTPPRADPELDLDFVLNGETSLSEQPHDGPSAIVSMDRSQAPSSRPLAMDDDYLIGFRTLPSSDTEGGADSDDSDTAPLPVPLIPVGQITDVYRDDLYVGSDIDFSAESAYETDVSSSERQRSLSPKRKNVQPRREHRCAARRPTTSVSALREPNRSHSDSDSNDEIDNIASYNGSVNVVRKKLPKTQYGRPRRILVPVNVDLPFVTVTMRADAQFFHRTEKFRITDSLPHSGSHCHVEDAIMLDNSAIIGYDEGPCQVSIVRMKKGEKPHHIPLAPLPHQHHELRGKVVKAGITSLAPVGFDSTTLRFISGGHDKWINLWDVTREGESFRSTTKRINVFHNASVRAVAYRPHDDRILSGAGAVIRTIHLERPLDDGEAISSAIHHIHIHPVLGFNHVAILEIFDVRKSGFGRPPCMQFGYRSQTKTTDHRHTKGATHLSFFARGYGDGSIRVWDYRNPKDVILKWHQRENGQVIHTAFAGNEIVAFSNSLREPFLTFLQPERGGW